jgi:ubiquinone/menaquinone biosynthesis C-methylase UbiE
MQINKIIDILIDPISKTPLIINENHLCNSENTASYEFSDNLIKLIPQSIKTNNYVEHYLKDAETFDYFEAHDCKVTVDDWNRLHQTILSKISNFNFKNSNSNLSKIKNNSNKINNLKDSVIIDVGSGNGWAAKELIAYCGKFISIDISEKNLRTINSMINQKNNINQINQNINENQQNNFFAIQADAMNMPFADNSIDYIISSEVIEHLPNPEKFVVEMYRILKPNGKIIISTPYKEKIKYNLCIHCNTLTPQNAHLHSFDENNLLKITHNCDNVEVRFHIFGNKVLHFARCYIFLQYLPLKLWHFVDKLANFVINKKQHIIMIVKKK